jgi:hypothetical protein
LLTCPALLQGVDHCCATATAIEFVNECATPVDIYWENAQGQRTRYMTLQPGGNYRQDTYVGHVWVVLAGEIHVHSCVGPQAPSTVILRPLHGEPAALRREDNGEQVCSDGYRQRGTATLKGGNVSLFAFGCVSDKAIGIAARTVEQMLQDADADICRRLVERKITLAVIGEKQVTSDMPPHSFLKGLRTSDHRCFDDGCRGVGATCAVPCTSVGEENCLMSAADPFSNESILVHEFGHCVMNCGFDREQMQRVNACYQDAMDAGGHGDKDTYMMSNVEEYWAELTQAWFHASIRTDVNNGIRTRADVERRDPNAAALLALVYGQGKWRYTQDCPNVAKWELPKHGLAP